MFAAGSIEELARHYRSQGGLLVSGVWSVLLSSSAEQSAEFARRYYNLFNEVAHGGWHLAVYATHSVQGGRDLWTPNPSLHSHLDDIRKKLTEAGENPPALSAVFFDQNVGAFNNRSVIIPFDEEKLASESLYRAGFEATHMCITRAFKAVELSPFKRVPPAQVNALLEQLDVQLWMHRIRSFLTKPLAALGNAALGGLVSAL